MTVKELIRELQNVPEDAIVLADHHLHGLYEVVKGIEYNDSQNAIYFWGNEIYDPDDEEDYEIPDDVDESNYNPYMGCDDYDYNPAEDIGWDI